MARLVVGCGYLGLRVARLWVEQGHSVMAVTRTHERAGQLAQLGIKPLVGDVVQRRFLGPLDAVEVVVWAVGWDRTSPRSVEEVYVGGVRELVDCLPADTRRLIYISSTGVYGQSDGQWVDEGSECRPKRAGGGACLKAEQVLLQSAMGDRTAVLRLAGLYGAGRLPRADDLTAGRPLAVDPNSLINLVHVADAASVVARVADAELVLPTTFLVSDGHPVTRGEFYRYLARCLGAGEPDFEENARSIRSGHRSTGNKRIRNNKLCETLPFAFRYPSYREGLAADFAE